MNRNRTEKLSNADQTKHNKAMVLNIDLRNFMESHVPYPVYFDNVSRAMALGEIAFGTGPKFDDLICINVGYGIGAGIVIGRKLFTEPTGSLENSGTCL